MNITKKWLEKNHACSEGTQWFLAQTKTDLHKVVRSLIKEDRLAWANWTVTHAMNDKQRIRYTVYAAKQVLNLFEKYRPGDLRPRNAIKATERYLKTGNKTVFRDAADAAASAGYEAFVVSAADFTSTTTHAAVKAAHAAVKAAHAVKAVYATCINNIAENAAVAYICAVAAARAAGDDANIKTRIIVYGLKLLKQSR